MALFDTYSRSSKELDKALKQKLEKKSKPKTGKSNNLLSRINLIRKRVEENLGQYTEDYDLLIKDGDIINYFNNIIEKGICAIDTETTGLNYFTDQIVGICLYVEGKNASYIPLNHISNVYQTRIENQANIELVKKMMKKCVENNVKFIYHNGKFDLNVLQTFLNFEMNCPYWDTLVASHLIHNLDDVFGRGLKQLYAKYCGDSEGEDRVNTLNKFHDLFEDLPFSHIPVDVAYIYGARDAYMTYELYKYQENLMKKPENNGIYNVYRNIEIPLIEVTARMQRTGVTIDMELANKLKKDYTKRLNELTDIVYTEIDKYEDIITKYRLINYNNKLQEPINFNSNTQLAILLYDIIGVENPDKEKPRGVGEDILKKIDIPLTKAVLEYRTVKKLLSTYIEAIPSRVEPTTGRLHASFNQNGADTGRFSSSNPNLQNIPRDGGIRHMFKASEGYYLVGADYSQQEPRLTAHFSDDDNMIEAYRIGKDLYSTMASLVYNTPYEECREFRVDGTINPEGKKKRGIIKAIFLGICYGKGVPAIANDLNITPQEAQEVYNSVFDTFPKFKKWSEDVLKQAKKDGYTETLWGRKRYLEHIQKSQYEYEYGTNRPINFDPLFDSNEEIQQNVEKNIINYYNNILSRCNFNTRRKTIEEAKNKGIIITDNSYFLAESTRQVVNGIIQGSAADLTKKAMVEIHHNKELNDLGFRLLMSVHDENIGECPKENVEKVQELLSKIMIDANDRCSVPMKCDTEVSEYWYGPNIDVGGNLCNII